MKNYLFFEDVCLLYINEFYVFLLPENEPEEARATTRAAQAMKKTPVKIISLLSIRLLRFHHGGFLQRYKVRNVSIIIGNKYITINLYINLEAS